VNKRTAIALAALLGVAVVGVFLLFGPRTGRSAPPSVADLVAVHSTVRVEGSDVRGARRLSAGDGIETDAAGKARIRLDDGTAYVLDSATRIKLAATGAELEHGRLFMQGAPGVRSELVLGAASVLLSGCNAGVERGSDGRAKVYAANDELTIRAGGTEHKVRVGESAAIDNGTVRVAPEKVFEDWTGGLSAPWSVAGAPRTAIGELWGRSKDRAGEAGSALTLRAHEVRAKIDGEFARTTVRSTFFNGGSASVMGDYRIAIPRGAIVSRFAWGAGEKLEEAQIALASREPGKAQPNAAVIEWAGEGWLRGFLPEVASGASVSIELAYVEWLKPKPRGKETVSVEYRYPLAAGGAPPLVGEFLAEIDASRARPIAISAGYGARAEGNLVKLRKSDFRPSADLVVEVELPRFAAPARAYVADAAPIDDSGKTVLVRTEVPEAAADSGVTLVLVVDTSASSEAALEASRAFVSAVLGALGAQDQVVALAADQSVRPLGPPQLGALDAARKKAILDALARVEAGGATDLGRALEAAADALPAASGSGLVVYVGDGWATVGDTNVEAIEARLLRRSAGMPRLSAVAVGPVANRGALAALTRGAGPLLEIADSSDAARAAIDLVAEALKPTLAGVEIDLGPDVERVYPRTARAALAGDTLEVVGRARGPLPEELTLRFHGKSGKVEERRRIVRLASDPDLEGDVRRRWAQARVEEFVIGGGGREIATEVALNADLLTPWTGFRIGSGTYQPSALDTRVLDLSPASLTSVLGAPRGQLGALNALALEPDRDEVDDPALLERSLSAATSRAIREAVPAVRTCRDSRAALKPELAGALALSLAVDGQGRASNVSVRGSSGADDAALNRCVQVVVEGLRYPAVGGTVKVRVDVTLQLPPAPNMRKSKCSSAALVALPLRRGLWRERFSSGSDLAGVYLEAKHACELPSWSDRRALLELLLDYRSDGASRIELARKLEESGEREAGAFLRREAVRRAASPEELTQVQLALIGDESYPAGTFKKRYRAAANDEERLRVVQQFLTLAPHDAVLERRLLALLDGLGRKPALLEETRRIKVDPFADATLLADAAALLRKNGEEAEARRIFGELVERAPSDPWVRAFVGDRLRNEGWFDDATRVYSVLDELAPDHPAALTRLALAHHGAGRIDIARRLLARVAETGGRAGDAQLGKLARGLSAILLADARKTAGLTPEQSEQLERAALQIGDGKRQSIVLVRTPAATQPVKVTLLRGTGKSRSERVPDVAAASMGVFLFLVEPGDDQTWALRLARPAELAPAPPLPARIDSIQEPAPGRLPSREIELPLDGKPIEVPWPPH